MAEKGTIFQMREQLLPSARGLTTKLVSVAEFALGTCHEIFKSLRWRLTFGAPGASGGPMMTVVGSLVARYPLVEIDMTRKS